MVESIAVRWIWLLNKMWIFVKIYASKSKKPGFCDFFDCDEASAKNPVSDSPCVSSIALDSHQNWETGFLRQIWWGCEKYQRNPVSGTKRVRIYAISPKKPGFYGFLRLRRSFRKKTRFLGTRKQVRSPLNPYNTHSSVLPRSVCETQQKKPEISA